MFNVAVFTYQAEIILCLATKLEIGWYTRNMIELQPPNYIEGFTRPIRYLITRQTTS